MLDHHVAYQDTIDFLERRERARQRGLDERFAVAEGDFNQILQLIVSEFKPLRVWQWGSLLDRASFTEVSDIDVAVEGMGSAEAFFSLWTRARKLTDLPLDIVEMERIEPEFADLIRRHGRLVHGHI